MLISKVLFEIRAHEAVRIGLLNIKGFAQYQDGFTWYDKKKPDGRATILGRVEIKGNKLTLECQSKKRLERGKKLIAVALSDAVVHKLDTFQDPIEAIRAHREKSPETPENELPMEIQQKLYSQFMQDHYEKWFGDRIPVLDGKTPVEEVKTQEGTLKVIELLKLYENGEERNKQESRPYYDLAWAWKRFGIKKE